MEYKIIWKILAIGFGILSGAIIMNILADTLEISTWYSFIVRLNNNGLITEITGESLFSLFFLFILYPFLLGLIGYLITKKDII
jgi:hypothetical protein